MISTSFKEVKYVKVLLATPSLLLKQLAYSPSHEECDGTGEMPQAMLRILRDRRRFRNKRKANLGNPLKCDGAAVH